MIFLDTLKKKSLRIWTDKISYFHILGVWFSIIFIFGCMYFFFPTQNSYIAYSATNTPINNLKDAIYFSFVTATTTGFGDIIPKGIFKFVSVFEVIFGLMLLAIVTSKLVSAKQDVILGELYDISFSERISRLRSTLLTFRQNLDRFMSKIEYKILAKRELQSISIYLYSLEDTLKETLLLVTKQEDNQFIKYIDPVSTELISNSILSSWEKYYELMQMMNQHRLEWKNETTLNIINRCTLVTEEIFSQIGNQKQKLKSFDYTQFKTKKDQLMKNIKEELKEHPILNKPKLNEDYVRTDIQEQTKIFKN